jgi:CrcB protein
MPAVRWGRWDGVGLAQATPHGPGGWPWGTFAVNMIGALALGYLCVRIGIALERRPPRERSDRHGDRRGFESVAIGPRTGGPMSASGWIAVGLLGGVAAAARFLIDTAVTARSDHPFPHGVLAINLAGALILGLVAGLALEGEALVIVAGGGIGSFTTFSTWMLDSHRLAEAGHTHLVWLNIGLSLVAGSPR